jgi:Lrp/AsnC family leucine-responsive transcriptional regulator
MPRQLDQIDIKILGILQERGRISNVDLSREIELSPAPTLERVRKLEKLNYIEGYHATVNQALMGITVKALIKITIQQHQGVNLNEFIEAVMKIPEVTECYQVTGDFDYMLQVMTSDIVSLDKLITTTISKIPAVGQIKSYIILSVVKQSKVLPLLNAIE